MKKIDFTKIVASGNDFVVAKIKAKNLNSLAKQICNRKFGVGADGLLVLEKSRVADIRMRILNADGSEAEMCGNGARSIALYLGRRSSSIETKAGIIKSEVNGENVKINLTDPRNVKLDIPIRIMNRNLKVNFIDTGVPHAIIFVEGLDEIHVARIGRAIRYHSKFYPRGTNADFVEVKDKDLISIRTYERGVEDETLACGTGAVASALIYSLKVRTQNKIRVQTQGKKTLKVYFDKAGQKFRNVWLEGKAKIVYKGVYYV